MKKARAQAVSTAPSSWEALLGKVTNIDCIRGLEQMPAACVDLVFADPPFNIGRAYPDHDDAMEADEYLQWSARWVDHCARVLKTTGSLWICASEEYVSELKVVAEGRYALASEAVSIRRASLAERPRRTRLRQRHHAIWHYTFGMYAPKKLTRSKTHLLHFVKGDDHTWNEEAVRVPSARQVVYKDKRADPRGRLPDDTWILRPQDPRAGFTSDADAQHFSRVCGTYREKRPVDNQMPEQLLGRVIRLCTNPGDLVLDPFAGSGTTAAVARKLGRRFLTFELSETYAALASERVEVAKEGGALDGAPVDVQTADRNKGRDLSPIS